MRTSSQSSQRHGVRVQVGEPLLLPAVDGQGLAEVAVAVEQADRRERHAEVGRRLQVVAGEHAEAAGVLRDRLGDAELGGEVRDHPVHRGCRRRRSAGTSAAGPGRRPAQLPPRPGDPRNAASRRQLLESAGSDVGEHPSGVVVAVVPRLWVDRREQLAGRAVPGPAEVPRQPVQAAQRSREVGADGERALCLHRGRG